MGYWPENVNRLLELNAQPLLSGAGSVSNAAMESRRTAIYGTFNTQRKKAGKLLADKADLQEVIAMERQVKNRK